MVNTILKEADLFCPNSVRINFTIYQTDTIEFCHCYLSSQKLVFTNNV
ncbi:Aspartate aminotransferase [Lactiplantibacillus plantarum]|nr:Aspartate aminotransferase [Lactiplantibacillus plantarum]KZT96339.1 Aspartate aminotransferase [Lactiplantibacillus plantarum]